MIKQLHFKWMLLLCALMVGTNVAWAAEETTIASFSASGYNGGTTNGWSVANANYSSSGGGFYQLISNNASITTPSINWSEYKDITITITARKYGGPDATQGKISASQGSTELATYSPGGTSLVASSALSISPSGTGSLTIACLGASSNKGCGVSAIVIKGTLNSGDPSSAASFADLTPSIDLKTKNTYTQTASTAAGYTGVVTYSITANTAGATINTSTGTLTAAQEGSVTVMATASAVDGSWASSSATYTLTVNDTRSASGLDYAESEVEIEVGEILPSPLTNPNGLDVSFESDDTSIATVDAGGNVTGEAIGTATITARFDGNSSYKPGSVSFTVKVKRAAAVGELFYEGMNGYTGSSDVSTALTTSYANLDSKDWNSFSSVYAGKVLSGDENGHLKFGSGSNAGTAVTKSIALTGSGKLTYKVQRYDTSNSGNLKITVTGATATGDVDVTGGAAWAEKTVMLTNANGAVKITFETTSSNKRIRVDDITVTQLGTITLNAACTDGAKYYGTYSSSKAFVVPADLTVTEIDASTGKLSLANYATGEIVPANTGVMVSSTTAGEHTVALATGGTSKLGASNSLYATGDAGVSASDMTTAAGSGKYFYRLTMHNGSTLGFWWGAAEGAAFALAANKAYLAVPTSVMASGLIFGDEEVVTGISAVEHSTLNIRRCTTSTASASASPRRACTSSMARRSS